MLCFAEMPHIHQRHKRIRTNRTHRNTASLKLGEAQHSLLYQKLTFKVVHALLKTARGGGRDRETSLFRV